jgi:heptosyltransferase-2
MKLTDFDNIVLNHTAFIGDVVLALPLTQLIKNIHPKAKITFITTPVAAELPQICDAVDEVIIFDKRNKFRGINGTIKFAALMYKYFFDLWISPHKSFRSTLIAALQKNTFRIGFDNASLSFLYDIKVKYYKNYHEIERNLELLMPFNIISNGILLKDVKITLNQNDINTAENIIEQYISRNSEYIVVSPGSVWETKKWREEYFIELCKMLINSGYQVLLNGSKSDEIICKRIALSSGAFSIAGLTNISQSLYIIKNAGLVITNDSAPTHFAGLVNTPVITIYGPTSPIFGFSPRSDINEIIYNENLKCSPCRIHGSKKCPLNTHVCMKSIKPEIVFKDALNIIGRKNNA